MPWVLFLLIGASAWTAAVTAAPQLPQPFATAVYAAASIVCHQIPARSFAVSAGPLAVCARCAGLYLGGVAGFAAVVLLRRSIGYVRWPLVVLAAAAAPTAVTVIAEWGIGLDVTNAPRFAAALPLGAAVAVLMGAAVTADARQVR